MIEVEQIFRWLIWRHTVSNRQLRVAISESNIRQAECNFARSRRPQETEQVRTEKINPIPRLRYRRMANLIDLSEAHASHGGWMNSSIEHVEYLKQSIKELLEVSVSRSFKCDEVSSQAYVPSVFIVR